MNYGKIALHQYASASPAGEDVAGYSLEVSSIFHPDFIDFNPDVLAMIGWGAYSDTVDYQRFSALIGIPFESPAAIRFSQASRAYVAGGFEYQNADIGTNDRDTAPTVRIGVRERHGSFEVDVHGRLVAGDFDYWASAAAVHYPVTEGWDVFGGAELWDGDLGGVAGASARF
ncbi:hypothetical protein [Halorhodospira halophila]|uniref:hypothetical protein n=1 Tax=Halorhodospira halophila TaxID=1053 RepID=UPI0005A0569E|nr:hypothetical protein [Halorhodospira halophila]MBK1729405.1 hypothetical protein [Halorhodospira halophila]